jgi:hypothetical protein
MSCNNEILNTMEIALEEGCHGDNESTNVRVPKFENVIKWIISI